MLKNSNKMDWNNDLEITSKKLIPRLGRRTGQILSDENKSDDDVLESPISLLPGKSTQRPIAPPRSRKTGWGDELKSGKSKLASNIEQERLRMTDKEEQEDDIPVIPDLDEIQEDNISSEIASAPTISTNRVTAYEELDTDLVKNAALTSLDGVSLSLLADKLYNENVVKELDEVWNWNLLFTQISSEINNEMQKIEASSDLFDYPPIWKSRYFEERCDDFEPCRRAHPCSSSEPRSARATGVQHSY